MLVVTGAEAKEACGKEQFYSGIEAGIEGGVHMVRIMRQQHAQDEEWGFLVIDAHNAFNEDNHTAMLWEVRHE